jgi:transposase
MSKPVYTPEYRERLIELVRSGRSPEKLAEEFEPCAATIRAWVKQADLNEGRRSDGLTSEEREENRRLRRENRRLREERDILKKAAVWFARETENTPPKRSDS